MAKKPDKYVSDYKNLMLEWDWEINNKLGLDPTKLSSTSHKKANWICSKCGNKWPAIIGNRSRGHGCSRCVVRVGRKPLKYISEVERLMLEWDWEINNKLGLDPTKLSSTSHKKANWICSKCGNKWPAEITSRNSGSGCPECSRKKQIETLRKNLLKKNGSLAEKAPYLVPEWHPTKNGNITPDNVLAGSNERVWWLCSFGHEWSSKISNRSILGRGCPKCAKETQTSFPEQAIYYYLMRVILVENRKQLFGQEVDIFIPSLNIAIEYDGAYFHSGNRAKRKEAEKDNVLRRNNVRLIRIKESDKNKITDDVIEYECVKCDYSNLSDAIGILFEKIGLAPTEIIDVYRDSQLIRSNYVSSIKRNSFAVLRPIIAKEWHPTKNGNLTPDMFLCYSNVSVWWLCGQCGNEWQAPIGVRARGIGCKNCGLKKQARMRIEKALDNGLSLAMVNPDLAKEWHPTKNGKLTPDMVIANSHDTAWWLCSQCGNEWRAQIKSRNAGYGCDICARNKRTKTRLLNLVKKKGSLAEKRPELAKEWHPVKNGDLVPDIVTCENGREVWWLCNKCGNEWKMRIDKRVRGHGCSKCSEEC